MTIARKLGYQYDYTGNRNVSNKRRTEQRLLTPIFYLLLRGVLNRLTEIRTENSELKTDWLHCKLSITTHKEILIEMLTDSTIKWIKVIRTTTNCFTPKGIMSRSCRHRVNIFKSKWRYRDHVGFKMPTYSYTRSVPTISLKYTRVFLWGYVYFRPYWHAIRIALNLTRGYNTIIYAHTLVFLILVLYFKLLVKNKRICSLHYALGQIILTD